MSSGATQGCLVLVDAHALIFQVFHAIREPMTGPDGRPTNALFGFTRDLFTLRDSLKPDYLVCAFDCAGPTFRNAIAADYKAHRPPPAPRRRPSCCRSSAPSTTCSPTWTRPAKARFKRS